MTEKTPTMGKLKTRNTLSALILVGLMFGAKAAMGQSLTLSARVPADIDTSGLRPDELRHVPTELTVDVPLTGATVNIRLYSAQGGDPLGQYEVALTQQQWADGTWAATVDGGTRVGLGRYTGIDAAYVEVRNGETLIGTGGWTRE